MPWLSPHTHTWPVPDRNIPDSDLNDDISIVNEPEDSDEWLLIDSDGDGTPAAQRQLDVRTTVEVEVGRTAVDPQPLSDTSSRPESSPESAATGAVAQMAARSTSPTQMQTPQDRGTLRVLFNFVAAENRELSITEGEDVMIHDRSYEPDGWLIVKNAAGQIGWIPKAYVLALTEEEADSGRNAAVGTRVGEEGSTSVVLQPQRPIPDGNNIGSHVAR